MTLSKNRKEQLMAVGLYGLTIGLLAVGIVTISLMQLNILENLKQENTNKVEFARISVKGYIDSVRMALQGAAKNQDLLTAIETNDKGEFINTSRIIYESNRNILRVIIEDKKGDGVSIYPQGTFDVPNFAFRPYFRAARETKQPFVTDVYETLVDEAHRKLISVAVPVFARDNTFAGVLLAWINLDAIAAKLQQIPSPERHEYVELVDPKGKRIVSYQQSLVGTPTDEQDDPILLGVQGKRGVADGKMYDGKPALVFYDSVEGLNWGIAIKTPIAAVYRITNSVTLVLFGIILAIAIMATVFLEGLHLHWWGSGRERRKGS